MFGIWNSLEGLGDCGPLRPQITATAMQYGLDPNIAYNQLQQESHCDPYAVSPTGAVGIAQFMPGTWLQWGSPNVGDRTNISASLDAFGAYMRDLLDTNGGDYRLALAAYNAGQRRVDYYGDVPPFQETQNYVAKILGSLGLGQGRGSSSGGDVVGTSPAVLDFGSIGDGAAAVGLSATTLLVLAMAALIVLKR